VLTNTFCHVKGISVKTEKILWDHGVTSWDDFYKKKEMIACIPKTKLALIEEELPHSKKAFEKNDLQYFKKMLASKEHWRLHNRGNIAYVDIETSGISRDDYITVIGIYDGMTSHLYVHGKNLEEAHDKLKEFEIIVTYNGKQFDLPIIERHFGYKYPFVHLDLRFMMNELGFKGGLKSIERQLGVVRDADVADVNGFEAIHLWNQYQRGCQKSLEKLLKYNEQDIIHLKTLLQYYLDRKINYSTTRQK
jgi:uncharacterized protein YprB with RNaseH-like and TPR domain